MLWVIDTVRERGSVEPPRLNDPDCKNATTKGGESACGAAGGDHIQVLATTTSQVDEDSICSTSL